MKNILIIILFFSLTIINGYSQDVNFVFPRSNQVLSDTLILFHWDKVAGNQQYQFQLSNDSLYQNLIIDTSVVYDKVELDVDYSLSPYFIRVKHSVWSKTVRFNCFNPKSIDSLMLWLSADTGVVKDGNGKVSQWNDLSGNGNHAYQNVLSYYPDYIATAMPFNVPAINLNGNSFLSIDSFILISSIYAVANYDNNSSVFSDYDGLLARQKGTIAPIGIFMGYKNQNYLWNHAAITLFGSNVKVNNLTTTSFAPLEKYKVLSGHNQYSTGFKLNIGKYLSNNSLWKGNVLEIIDYAKPLDSSEIQLVNKYLLDKYTPPVNVGANILRNHSYCDTNISTSHMYESYLWNTGDTTRGINVARYDTGWYWCDVPNLYGDIMRDSIYVYNLVPDLDLSDTTICLNTNSDVRLPYNSDYTFEWKDAIGSTIDTDSALQATLQGQYSVKITDDRGCYVRDTLNVFVDSFSVYAGLGSDKMVCTGERVGLITEQTKANSWTWNTGSMDSLIVIDTAGVYILHALDTNGCEMHDTISLQIKGIAPKVGFTVDSICFKNASVFLDTSYTVDASNIVHWEWNFGDGSPLQTFSSASPVYHVFPDSGTYEVKLITTTDSTCANYAAQTAFVYALPEPDFSPAYSCSGLDVQLNSLSLSPHGNITQWEWKFGDTANASAGSQIQHPIYNYQGAGTFSVLHKVQSEFGCRDSLNKNILVRPSPIADFTVSNSCDGEPIYFTENNVFATAVSPIERKWKFHSQDSSTLASPHYKFDSAGYYNTFYYVKASNGCWDTITKGFVLHPLPEIQYSTQNFCEGKHALVSAQGSIPIQFTDTISEYLWTIDTLGSIVIQDIELVFQDTLTHPIRLTLSSSAGCQSVLDTFIQVHPNPTAGFTLDKPYGLPPLSVQFTNLSTGAESYLWDFGNGQFSTLENPYLIFNDSAIHDVVLTASSKWGCADTSKNYVYAIYAAIDIAVEDVQIDIQDGYIQYRCMIRNVGQRPVHDLWLEAGFNNVYHIRENWSGTIKQNEVIPYNFSAQSSLRDISKLQYFCVKAEIYGEQKDERLHNNEMCSEYKQEVWFSAPYPNPVGDMLNLDCILPYKGTVEARIYNTHGQQVHSINIDGQKGINRIQVPTFHLPQGLYYLELRSDNIVEVKEFVK